MEVGVLVFKSGSKSPLWKDNLWAVAWRKSEWARMISDAVSQRGVESFRALRQECVWGLQKQLPVGQPEGKTLSNKSRGSKKQGKGVGWDWNSCEGEEEGGLGIKNLRRQHSGKSLSKNYLLRKPTPCRNGLALIPWLCSHGLEKPTGNVCGVGSRSSQLCSSQYIRVAHFHKCHNI